VFELVVGEKGRGARALDGGRTGERWPGLGGPAVVAEGGERRSQYSVGIVFGGDGLVSWVRCGLEGRALPLRGGGARAGCLLALYEHFVRKVGRILLCVDDNSGHL
jgi:hypothetical protein